MATKSVQNGVLLRVSPSAITTWESCQRKHWYKYVAGIPEPEPEPGGPLATGTQIHAEIEDWLKDGKAPEHPSVVQFATEGGLRAASAGGGLLVEHPKDYALGILAAGVPVAGRIDFLDASDPERVTITDWKSTSSFARNKSPDELARDTQLVVYGRAVFEKLVPEAQTVTLGQTYLLTSGVGWRRSKTDPLTRADLEPAYAAVEQTVERMKVTAAELDPALVATDLRTCYKYGYKRPCPYVTICTEATQGAPVEETLAKKLAARKSVQGINPPDAAKPEVKRGNSTASGDGAGFVSGGHGSQTDFGDRTGPTRDNSEESVSSRGAGRGGDVFAIYVDCAPSGLPASRLEDEIARRTVGVLKAHPKATPKMVDVRELPFGEGTTALMASFRTAPLTGAWLVTSGGLSSAVLEVLVPQAGFVVRGSR